MARLVASTSLAVLAALTLSAADKPQPKPSGPQSDGVFHKVVLDADRDLDGDGTIDDVVVDPMEIATAPDGRVFLIERSGVVKIWKPDTKATVVAAKLEVFKELEDGLIGIALDPKFAENHWVYLFHSEPGTRQTPGIG
jgi:glucose/arabinose dehydrogenase